MAQLLLVNAFVKHDDPEVILSSKKVVDTGAINDIVGIFENDHVFSPAESAFTVKSVKGTKVQVEANLDKLVSSQIKAELAKEESSTLIPKKYWFHIKDHSKTEIVDMCECNYGIDLVGP